MWPAHFTCVGFADIFNESLLFLCLRKLVVRVWASGLPEVGGAVQGGGSVSTADAETGNSSFWAEDLHLLPAHLTQIPGDPPLGERYSL